MADFLGICKNCRGTCCKIGGTDFTRKEKDQVLRKVFLIISGKYQTTIMKQEEKTVYARI